MIDTSAYPEFHYPAAELSEADRLLRAGRITASIAPMICEESEWGGPLRAYRIAKGLDTFRGNASTLIGNLDEPKIGALYQLRHPEARLYRPGTRVHPELPWLAATVDFLAVDSDEAVILEAKSTDERNRAFWGAPGTAEVPAGYRIQVAVQMAVWGVEHAVFGLLIGRDDYREYEVARSREFEANVLRVLSRFQREHLEASTPPTDEDRRLYTQTVYPAPVADVRDASDEPETVACVEDAKRAARDRARANAEYERAVSELVAQIGPNEGVQVGTETITWRLRANARERVVHVPAKWHQIEEASNVESAA